MDVARDNGKPREGDGSTKDDGVTDVFQAAEGVSWYLKLV